MSDLGDAFALFGDAWITALLLAALLPLPGVVLLARQQVFLGAAAGQAATLGLAAALSLGLGHGPHDEPAHVDGVGLGLALAAGAAVAASAMRALSRQPTGLEARNAWVFLVGGAGSVVLLSGAPHGLHEVQRLQLSTLLGAAPADVWVAAAVLLASVAAAVFGGRQLGLWAFDPETARALGVRVGALDVVVGSWLGCTLAFAIHVAGLLFAFGFSVLPVLVAREIVGSLRGVVVLGPLVGLAACALGLGLAHAADLPPGQVSVTLLGAMVVLAAAARRLPRRAGV